VFRPSTRERILEEGLKLACTRGICRITFGAIALRAEVSKSGIVGHFSSADKLKAAVIAGAIEVWRRVCLVPAESSSGLAELMRYLCHWMSWTKRAGLPGGCPIASAMIEYEYEGPFVRGAVVAAEAQWRETLVELIEGAIAVTDLPRRMGPTQMARRLLGIYLGHQVSRHFLRASEADREAYESVDQLIESAKRSV
jgi:AcrR family transcriptional regulator